MQIIHEWWFPALGCTVLSVLWALLWPPDWTSLQLQDDPRAVMLVCALLVSGLCWAVALANFFIY